MEKLISELSKNNLEEFLKLLKTTKLTHDEIKYLIVLYLSFDSSHDFKIVFRIIDSIENSIKDYEYGDHENDFNFVEYNVNNNISINCHNGIFGKIAFETKNIKLIKYLIQNEYILTNEDYVSLLRWDNENVFDIVKTQFSKHIIWQTIIEYRAMNIMIKIIDESSFKEIRDELFNLGSEIPDFVIDYILKTHKHMKMKLIKYFIYEKDLTVLKMIYNNTELSKEEIYKITKYSILV